MKSKNSKSQAKLGSKTAFNIDTIWTGQSRENLMGRIPVLPIHNCIVGFGLIDKFLKPCLFISPLAPGSLAAHFKFMFTFLNDFANKLTSK